MKLLKLNSHPHNYTFFSPRLQCRRELSAAGLPCRHHAVHPGLLRLWRGLEHRYLHSPAPQDGAQHGRVPGWVTPQRTSQVAPHGIVMFLLWKTSKLVFSLVLSAIQALRSVLNAFCVVNRKNMFVYQERTTKSVFYLRWVTSSAFFHISYWPIWAFQWMMLVSEEQSKQELHYRSKVLGWWDFWNKSHLLSKAAINCHHLL